MVRHGHACAPTICAMVDWDRRPGVPKYVQVADLIAQGIRDEEYPGGFLLSERAIPYSSMIARGTARKAVAELRRRELVFTVPNMGTYVGRPENPA